MVPYSMETAKELLDVMRCLMKHDAFNDVRNEYVKTHFVASILERVGGSISFSDRIRADAAR